MVVSEQEVKNELENKKDILATKADIAATKADIALVKEDLLKLQIDIEKRFNQLTLWIVGTGIAITGVIVAVIKL